MPAELARARAQIQDVVGGADRLLVVLDHQHGVAEIAQPAQRVEQAAVVALVQADRRLVEDVEHADQARADLGRQANALAFPARQRAGGPIQRQVVEADVHQEPEPLADLLEDPPRDRRLALAERQRREERRGVLDGEAHDVGDGAAADLEPERLRPQPRAAAGRTGPLGHERLDLRPRVLRLRLAIATVQHLHHALEAAVLVAEEDHVPRALAELRPRLVERELVALGQRGQRLPEVRRLPPRPRRQRPGRERAGGIGHQPLGIDLPPRADAAALRAGAVRVVEREHPRRDLGEGDAALGAGQPLREDHGLARGLATTLLGWTVGQRP